MNCDFKKNETAGLRFKETIELGIANGFEEQTPLESLLYFPLSDYL